MVKQLTYSCHHCGTTCNSDIQLNELFFCCDGCKLVYQILDENGLCQFYELKQHAGLKSKGKFSGTRFAYLNDSFLIEKLAHFVSADRINIRLQVPSIHCVSCIYLLENLHQIQPGIYSSTVDFHEKQVLISYNPQSISLQSVVELLAFIGYEPEIRIDDSNKSKKSNYQSNRTNLIRIGVAGFCFSNIMMLSFPDYFANGNLWVEGLQDWISWIILGLSLPVLFYSAVPFFSKAYSGLKLGILNIDAPIVLASLITFSRSYFEIITKSGSGYLDSGTGIIFFLLIGRWFQDRTQIALVFDRSGRSYFPLGVTILDENGNESGIPLDQLKVGNILVTRFNELIPADVTLERGEAAIDYHFIHGENRIQPIEIGESIYAGGKQMGGLIYCKVQRLPEHTYFFNLWNNPVFSNQKNQIESFIHPWSRWFTYALFTIATITGFYWAVYDSTQLWPSVTSILIVACPCSLLLTSTFTHGNMMRKLSRSGLFLKNASVIDAMSSITDLVLDKTGTLTQPVENDLLQFLGEHISPDEELLIQNSVHQSAHPLSRQLYHQFSHSLNEFSNEFHMEEIIGKGLFVKSDDMEIAIGNANFAGLDNKYHFGQLKTDAEIHVNINGKYKGFYQLKQQYRNGIESSLNKLSKQFNIHLLTGDHDGEKERIQKLLGPNAILKFEVSPTEKKEYIQSLQKNGKKVMMVGDGLNDAVAFMQSDVGIAVNNDHSMFTPASDGIIFGEKMIDLPDMIAYAKKAKMYVAIGFSISILYNIIGISLAVQNLLSPMIAAVLMPVSSISLIIISWLLTAFINNPKNEQSGFYTNQSLKL